MREFSCFLHNALRRIEVNASAPPRLLVGNDRLLDLRIVFNPSRKTGWSSTLRMRMGLGSGITMPSLGNCNAGPAKVKFRLSTSLGVLRPNYWGHHTKR